MPPLPERRSRKHAGASVPKTSPAEAFVPQDDHWRQEVEALGNYARAPRFTVRPSGGSPPAAGRVALEQRASMVRWRGAKQGNACYPTAACPEVNGLTHAGGCYEVRPLPLFRDEYVAELPDGAGTGMLPSAPP